MEHVDEGTLHAWLDGALSPGESDRIERHIASCKECSALAAEARGLIAASSRILSALDDVPAGVIPSMADSIGELARANRVELADAGTAGISAAAPASPVRRAKRAWFFSPQFLAAATAAFVAAGSFVVSRKETATSVTDFARPTAAVQAPSASAPEADGAPQKSPVDASAAKGAPQPTPAGDPRSTRRDAPADRTVKPLEPPPAAAGAASSLSLADAATKAEAARERRMGAISADSAASLPPAQRQAASSNAVRAPTPAAPPRAFASAVARDETVSEKRDTAVRAGTDSASQRLPKVPRDLVDKITVGERKRVVGESEAQVAVSGTSAFKSAAAGPVKEESLFRAIAGCYTIEPRSETTDAPIVRRAILDTTAAGEWLARPAWRVTLLSPATLRPVDFRWSLGAEGHVLLLERRDGRNYSWILDVPQATRSAVGIAARRMDCPER